MLLGCWTRLWWFIGGSCFSERCHVRDSLSMRKYSRLFLVCLFQHGLHPSPYVDVEHRGKRRARRSGKPVRSSNSALLTDFSIPWGRLLRLDAVPRFAIVPLLGGSVSEGTKLGALLARLVPSISCLCPLCSRVLKEPSENDKPFGIKRQKTRTRNRARYEKVGRSAIKLF